MRPVGVFGVRLNPSFEAIIFKLTEMNGVLRASPARFLHSQLPPKPYHQIEGQGMHGDLLRRKSYGESAGR